jgi:endonuclease III
MENTKIVKMYERLSTTYLTFSEVENEWADNGLDSTPFKSLVSVVLSTMTHTKRVIRAATALYAEVSTPQELLNLPDEHLTELIRPVAHYNRKTLHLKELARQLIERHGGEVPSTREELLALTGVGRKCVDIMMNFTFGAPAIAVDTHVFRVLNRVGIVHTESQTVAADDINRLTPDRFKQHAHEWLIQHGGKVCVARKPKCDECPLTDLCDYYRLLVKEQ